MLSLVLKIYFSGVIMLIGAIFLNYLGNVLGFNSWHDIITQKEKIDLYSSFFLFFIYPIGLGFFVYFNLKIQSLRT